MNRRIRPRLALTLLSAALAWAGAAQAAEIQGHIADGHGAPIAGVSIEFSGGLPAAVTDAQGFYSVLVPGGVGEFKVTPWKAGYFFSPATATVSVSGSSATANFLASGAVKLLAGPPTVTITSAPLAVDLGAPVTIQWQLFNFTPSAHNHIEWVSDADPFTIHNTTNTKKVGTTYWGWFNAPATNCTVSARIHVIYGANISRNSTSVTIQDGTIGPPLMAKVVIVAPTPAGANPDETITVTWRVDDGKPNVHNSIHWSQDPNKLDPLLKKFTSTPQVLTPDVVDPPLLAGSFQYHTSTIKVPNFTGKLYLQAHCQIDGEDYYSWDLTTASTYTEISVPNPLNGLVIIEPNGDPKKDTDVTDPFRVIRGSSQKCFTIAAAGTLTYACQFQVNTAGLPAKYLAAPLASFNGKVRVAIEPVGDSTLSWVDPAAPGTKRLWTAGNLGRPSTASTIMGSAILDPADNLFKVNAVFTNLPAHNTGFGFKKLFVQIVDGGTIVKTGQEPVVASTPVGAFYDRIAKNNPTAVAENKKDPTKGPITPNWFYYWKEGQVVKKSSGWKYSPGNMDPPAWFDQVTDPQNVFVTDTAPGVNKGPEYFFRPDGQKCKTTGNGQGPKCCAEAIACALQKKWFHDNFPLRTANDDDPYGDPDRDGVFNFVEDWCLGVATDPHVPDTYRIASAYPGKTNTGDLWLRCLRKELDPGIGVNMAADWSWPWKIYAGTGIVLDLPVVTVFASIPNADEAGPVNGEFTFTRGPSPMGTAVDLTKKLDVYYTTPPGPDIAIPGPDYATLPGMITIPVGAFTAVLPVMILPADGKGDSPPPPLPPHPPRTIYIQLDVTDKSSDAVNGYNLGSPNSATITVKDSF